MEVVFVDRSGSSLSGEELETYCKRHGLCHLCARVRTHRRVFRLLKKNEATPLTLKNSSGNYSVYKGYCLGPECFTLQQAMTLLGETGGGKRRTEKIYSFKERLKRGPAEQKSARSLINWDSGEKKRRPPLATASFESDWSLMAESRKYGSDDDVSVVSVGSTMTTNSSVRRSLSQLLIENAGTILDLSYTHLRSIHITELVTSMGMATSLESLILENCKLNDSQVETIIRGLAATKMAPILRLSLKSNAFGNQGAAAFYNLLCTNETIEELDLSKNNIGSRGAKIIIKAIHDNSKTKIAKLNLSHNEIWELNDGSFFAKNQTLQLLNLEGNFMHDEGVEAIAKGIALNKDAVIDQLYLGWNGIGDVGVVALAKMLGTNESLRILGLVENEVTSVGARALLSALSLNTSLQEITGLSQNQIDRKFVIAAIQRLLRTRSDDIIATPSSAHGLTDILEDAPRIAEPRIEPIERETIPEEDEDLDWAEKLYTPVVRPNRIGVESKPPVVEVGAPNQEARNSNGYYRIPKKPSAAVNAEEPKLNAVSAPESALPRPTEKPQNKSKAARAEASTNKLRGRRENEDAQSNVTREHIPVPKNTFDKLTVFQAAPLAYFNRETSVHHSIQLYDFDYETDLLKHSLKGTGSPHGKVDVQLEAATVENFKEAVAAPGSGVVHLSCYGHPDYILLENGTGYVDKIEYDSLPKLLKDGNLRVVIVLSYYAREIANALIDAGVPHVVCCPHSESFRDLAAMEFLSRLYRALAAKVNLKEAFATAKKAAEVEPISRYVDRYFLLPIKADNDDYHDVPVFLAEKISPRTVNEEYESILERIPRLPENFTGREVDIYEILEALREDDVVRIGGPNGIGKTTAVAAACRYIHRRLKAFKIDDIFWLPLTQGAATVKDSLYGDLCKCIDMIIGSGPGLWDQDDALACRDRIEIELEGKKAILAIDGRKFLSQAASQNLEIFLSHLLNFVDVKIILIVADDNGEKTNGRRADDKIILGPLSFKSTALLFGEVSRFITCNGCPAAQSPEEFAQLAAPPSVTKLQDQSKYTSERQRELLSYMGNGVPRAVIGAAKYMPADNFISLIGIGNQPEIQVDSHGALETEYRRWSTMKKNAIAAKNYLRGFDLEKILKELDSLRANFPTLDDLIRQERKLQSELATTLANRKYEAGTDIKRQLLALKKVIIHEKRAVSGQTEFSGSAHVIELQAHVDSIVRMTESLNRLDVEGKDENVGATFTFGTANHMCNLRIYRGSIVDFQPITKASAIVCWTNECCDLNHDSAGAEVLKNGGLGLMRDIDSLPAICATPWGDAKCGTGNAVVVGPGSYADLKSQCVVLAVGPISPSCREECQSDEEDRLHFIEIMLRSCLRSSLVLAKYSNLKEIAFPTLTTKLGGDTYGYTLKLGLKLLVEEATYSALSQFHIVASSNQEASRLIEMLSEMGLTSS